jgi:hypothetical protein
MCIYNIYEHIRNWICCKKNQQYTTLLQLDEETELVYYNRLPEL